MNDFWSLVSEKKIYEFEKLHKITHNPIKNRESTLILNKSLSVTYKMINCEPTWRQSIAPAKRRSSWESRVPEPSYRSVASYDARCKLQNQMTHKQT